MEEGKDCLFLSTETAWAPMPEMWDAIFEKHFRAENETILISYVFLSEEPGCDLYGKGIVFCGVRVDDCGSISSFDFLHKKSTSIVEIQTAFEICIRILHFFHQNTPLARKGF